MTLLAGPTGLSADEPGATVRVMSFNIRFGTARDGDNAWPNRRDTVAATIRAFDPDVLGTQETLGFQRDELLERLPGYAAFGAGRDDGKEAGEMTPIYYKADRFEKLDGGHFWLSDTPDVPGSRGWDAALPRVGSWLKLADKAAPGSPPVIVVNTHFDHKGVEARKQSGRLIRERVAALDPAASVILTGDFNTAEESPPYKAVFGPDEAGRPSRLVDTYRAAHPEKAAGEGTFSSWKATPHDGGRIDWIGASRDWTVAGAAIDRTNTGGVTPSDHFPVTAVLTRPATR